jgi:hypothetical protein
MTANQEAPGPDPGETARYIEQLARELRRLASEARLGFLAFLLRMVEDEAASTATKPDEDNKSPA